MSTEQSTQPDLHPGAGSDRGRSGRHPVRVDHLVMGLAFLGFVGVWALIQTDTVTGSNIHWLLPVPWVVGGAAGLVAIAVTGSRRHTAQRSGWVGDPSGGHRGGWVGHGPVAEPAPAPDPHRASSDAAPDTDTDDTHTDTDDTHIDTDTDETHPEDTP